MTSVPLHCWIERCQAFAAALVEGDAVHACDAFVELAATTPRGLTAAERVVVRRLLNDGWARVLGVLTGAADGAAGAAVDPRVTGALAAIDARVADAGFRLQALARELGISPTHLTQLLKRDTGRTFGAHLHDRRVTAAQLLLSQPGLSVKEIAARVGYRSSSQLDRHFKRRRGCAPSVFRAARGRARAGTPAVAADAPAAGGATQPATLPQK